MKYQFRDHDKLPGRLTCGYGGYPVVCRQGVLLGRHVIRQPVNRSNAADDVAIRPGNDRFIIKAASLPAAEIRECRR